MGEGKEELVSVSEGSPFISLVSLVSCQVAVTHRQNTRRAHRWTVRSSHLTCSSRLFLLIPSASSLVFLPVYLPVFSPLFTLFHDDFGGQKKSEPIVKSVKMTHWRRQRCQPRGFVTRDVVEIVWPLSRTDVYGSQSTGFSAHEGN